MFVLLALRRKGWWQFGRLVRVTERRLSSFFAHVRTHRKKDPNHTTMQWKRQPHIMKKELKRVLHVVSTSLVSVSHGDGVPQSVEKARYWLERAASREGNDEGNLRKGA